MQASQLGSPPNLRNWILILDMKAVIHCGMFKTGSTSIQNTAYYNRDALRKEGVLYPNTGMDPRASSENGEIGYRHSRFALEYGSKQYPSLLSALREELRAADEPVVFLSAEPWSHPQTAKSLKALVSHLRKCGITDVQGVVFIRNASNYMERFHREAVRRHSVALPLAEFIVSRKHFFDYLTICNNLNGIFSGKIDFINYDKVNDVNGLILDKLKVKPTAITKPPHHTNTSLSRIDIELRRILQAHGIHIKNMPPGERILRNFGLSLNETAITETVPDNFFQVYDGQYIRKFSTVTGLSFSESRSLFENNTKTGTDIKTMSPVLEKVLFEWLKQQHQPS